eukprot:363045-Chlamydomonas_euryale.AAC.8
MIRLKAAHFTSIPMHTNAALALSAVDFCCKAQKSGGQFAECVCEATTLDSPASASRMDQGVIPLRVGAALVQSTQNHALCVGGKNLLQGSRNFRSSCQPGQRSVCQRAKAGGGYFDDDPALSTSILCQTGQRGSSAPIEPPPQTTPSNHPLKQGQVSPLIPSRGLHVLSVTLSTTLPNPALMITKHDSRH